MFNHVGVFVKVPHGARAISIRPMHHQPANASIGNEQTFRPVIRPAVPILTVIDDGSIDEGEQIRIRKDSFVIGRKGGGCHIQLDDPLVATLHAELVADSSGGWKITGRQTRNGVWVSATATPLASCCFFQCGEQRFKFVIP